MDNLYNILLVADLVVSVLLIATVSMIPSRANAASALTGGADQMFGKQKARGFEAFLHRMAGTLGALFLIISFSLAVLSSR